MKKIDWDITKRLVIFLHYNNNMKKTNIAMKCNMGYDKFVLYLNWLDVMDLITREEKEGSELIRLSDKGETLYEKKFKEL